MINMKMTKKAAAEYASGPASAEDAPAYPYGLELCLNDDSLKQLGITDPPAVGTEMTLMAKVTVTSTGVNQQQDGDKEARCSLQITDMELSGGARTDTADVLYGT